MCFDIKLWEVEWVGGLARSKWYSLVRVTTRFTVYVFIWFVHRARALRSATSSGSAVSPAATVGAGNSDESSGLYLKQFVYSKAAQYRKLKMEWKTNVFLGRSNIQVRFLIYCRKLTFPEGFSLAFIYTYYMASSSSGQDERNPGLWLAARDYALCSARKICFYPLYLSHVRSRWLNIGLAISFFACSL